MMFQWFPLNLTGLGLHVDCFCLGQLQCSDPALPLYLRTGLEVVGLGSAIRNDKVTGVLHSNVGRGQVDGPSACVAHLCLGSVDRLELL